MYRRAGFFMLIFLLGVLLIGCQSAERKPLESQDRDRDSISASERRVLADRLSRLATEVKGVQKATVVISEVTLADSTRSSSNRETGGKANPDTSDADISGMIVMLGISINNQVDEAQTKAEVQKKLKASDKRISQVLVTSDPELVKKINDVAAGIIKGEPIAKHQMTIKELGRQFGSNNPAY
jgi:D-Tyr-tRNAtyr deacylase